MKSKKLIKMKKYEDYGINDDSTNEEDKENIKNVKWTKYKIVVPTEEDRLEVMMALEHCHNSSDIDTDYVTVNQIVHEYEPYYYQGGKSDSDKYCDPKNHNIIVDEDLYNKLNNNG